jgi:predicted acetyltransferase
MLSARTLALMSTDFLYEPMNSGPDDAAVGRLLMHAFAGTVEGVQEWLKNAGHEHMRVVRTEPGGPPRSCLLRIPMGQYFGGVSVPMVGIAAVATAPETRGQGLARRMMHEAMREAAREFPISVLYPSTQALYRQAGYEQAGHRLMARVPLATIDVRDRGGPVEHLSDADDEVANAAYKRFAARFDGMVDRGPYVWRRIKKFREEVYHGFGIRDGRGGLAGYMYLNQKRKPEPDARQEITLTDLAFDTPGAGRRLLGFLADFATMGDDVAFSAGPSHPALMLLGQQRYKLGFHYYWMLRVLNVGRALSARGYAPGIDAEVQFEIEDGVVPENNGRFTLRVRDGRGEVSRGGRGELRTSIRGLAAMYTGHMAPPALVTCGLAGGDERALRTAAAVFGGSCPWMTDFF